MFKAFKFLFKLILFLVVAALIAGAVLVAVNFYVVDSEKGKIVTVLDSQDKEIEEAQAERIRELDPECAIVLGAGIRDSETPTMMLQDRLDTGIMLYKKGLVPKLLLTGDNGQKSHNEIHVMLSYAKKHGVPGKDIFCDHAGFSTYDSMYRAVSIFHVNRAIVVTQEYHLYRSLYLADSQDIEVLGVASDEQSPYPMQAGRDLREFLARIKDFVKEKRNPGATFGGDEIPISGDDGSISHGE